MAADRQIAFRFWGLGSIAVLLCAGAALSYVLSMGNGIAAGDLIGLRGREGDVITAQRWARFWLTTSACCLAASSLVGALATRTYEEASRVVWFVTRILVAAVVSFIIAVLIVFFALSMAAASHHSVVR
jgi:hypothetical protein